MCDEDFPTLTMNTPTGPQKRGTNVRQRSEQEFEDRGSRTNKRIHESRSLVETDKIETFCTGASGESLVKSLCGAGSNEPCSCNGDPGEAEIGSQAEKVEWKEQQRHVRTEGSSTLPPVHVRRSGILNNELIVVQ